MSRSGLWWTRHEKNLCVLPSIWKFNKKCEPWISWINHLRNDNIWGTFDQILIDGCTKDAYALLDPPSRPFLDQTPCENSGVLVGRVAKKALRYNTQKGSTNVIYQCNRRNIRMRENFVLERSQTFVRHKFLCSEGSVTYTSYMHDLRMLLKFILSAKSMKYSKLNRVRKFLQLQFFWELVVAILPRIHLILGCRCCRLYHPGFAHLSSHQLCAVTKP